MKITEYTEIIFDGTEIAYVRIEHADGSFTSMTKTHYDEQLAQSKEIKP